MQETSTVAARQPSNSMSGNLLVSSTFTIVVPTLNASSDWESFASVLSASVDPDQVLILDSESTDGTPELARASGFRVKTIERAEFNHGGSRQMAAEMLPDSDILVYLTQDAVLHGPWALECLMSAFADSSVAAAYGRQLPRPNAGAIEAHAREFNYPAVSETRDLESRKRLGIKSIFISNSFAAYRRSALMEVGGFPSDIIFGEDTVTAGRFLLAGWNVAYVAEAQVYHSHAYTWQQEFNRYFDIGTLHARENWLLAEFGRATGEGGRFVQSEWKYLWSRNPWLIPSALIRTALKLVGYKLGLMEKRFKPRVKRRLSMHPAFWK